jgi:hypothetical protein
LDCSVTYIRCQYTWQCWKRGLCHRVGECARTRTAPDALRRSRPLRLADEPGGVTGRSPKTELRGPCRRGVCTGRRGGSYSPTRCRTRRGS